MQQSPILSDTLISYLRNLSASDPRAGSSISGVSSSSIARRVRKAVRAGASARSRILYQHGVRVPEMCFFSVTWRCSLSCKGCYAAGLPTDDNLTPTEIASILAETTAAGTVVYAIAGGEPLEVPGLIEILAGTTGGVFLLFTNGVLLNPSTVGRIARAGNILPVLSIEGGVGATDDRRGLGTGEAVASAMEVLFTLGVPFAFSTMVTHRNLRWVTSREYVSSMWDAGARLGFLVDYIPVAESLDPGLMLTERDRDFKRSAVAERAIEQRPLIVNFPEGEYASGGCMSAGNGFVHIGANGDVEPCTFSHYSTHNLRSSSYVKALSSPFFTAIRAAFSERPNPTGTCMLHEHDDEVAEIAAANGARVTSATAVAAPAV